MYGDGTADIALNNSAAAMRILRDMRKPLGFSIASTGKGSEA